ncbi:branched-chain amino acid transport system permease protein [Aneurinibacillus soli]|uniref:High-affinity branched-chain amino acid transport system permease protein LivH n=1 Tax=Aneurinibacillus soli TaxID=1500254 RepID=A0A0U5AZH8_9BACL|nr:branched-chain amino acid ABC transporter permease [Aneurinibacillus soli]PYE61214.1 branched-chain amino acid transport system permease protein [Aneurinibacillus soli]BAU26351.1 High-affinity branched-chain amino acid transport system permease protein LivH [Aneurinibacillus soli]
MLTQQLINGLTLGSTYALVALGYTLIFGVLEIINMAHGEIFMFGAFVGLMTVLHYKGSLLMAIIAAIIATMLIGLLMEWIALRPLRRQKGASHLASLISTIGISIFLENLAHKLFGPETQPFPIPFTNVTYEVGSVRISLVQIIIFTIAVAVMIALQLWLGKTRYGRALRATAENIETAAILGVNTRRIILLTVLLASALGGLAGVLVGMGFNAVTPTMGVSVGLKGLAIIILGGMGSVPGAMVGGLVLGVTEVLAVVYGDSAYRDAVAFGMIIVILLLRPQGIFGSKQPVRR